MLLVLHLLRGGGGLLNLIAIIIMLRVPGPSARLRVRVAQQSEVAERLALATTAQRDTLPAEKPTARAAKGALCLGMGSVDVRFLFIAGITAAIDSLFLRIGVGSRLRSRLMLRLRLRLRLVVVVLAGVSAGVQEGLGDLYTTS